MALYNPLLIKKLEKILEEDPGSNSFCSLAQIYLSEGNLEKAEKICLEGLNHNPSSSQAYVILGEIYRNRKEMEKAIKALIKAKEFNPDNPNIYRNLGEIYRIKNDMEKTLSAYKMVSFLRPGDKTAISTVQHLEKILGKSLIKTSSFKKISEDKTLYGKQKKKLAKLNAILARVEGLIDSSEERI